MLNSYLDLVESIHIGNLNVLGSRLHDLQQTLDSQLDCLILVHSLGVVLLQKLSNGFARSTDCVGFPCRVDTTGFGLVQAWGGVCGIESDDES